MSDKELLDYLLHEMKATITSNQELIRHNTAEIKKGNRVEVRSAYRERMTGEINMAKTVIREISLRRDA